MGSVRVGGRICINFHFVDDMVVKAEAGKNAAYKLPLRLQNVHIQDGYCSWQVNINHYGKQTWWFSKRDQDKRSNLRRGKELQISGIRHL